MSHLLWGLGSLSSLCLCLNQGGLGRAGWGGPSRWVDWVLLAVTSAGSVSRSVHMGACGLGPVVDGGRLRPGPGCFLQPCVLGAEVVEALRDGCQELGVEAGLREKPDSLICSPQTRCVIAEVTAPEAGIWVEF